MKLGCEIMTQDTYNVLDMDEVCNELERMANDKGMSDRINGVGEFEDDE